MVGLSEHGVSMAAIELPPCKKIALSASDAFDVQRHLQNVYHVQVRTSTNNCFTACRNLNFDTVRCASVLTGSGFG